MYQFKDIRTVHLEVTTRCNAACPQCPRNYESAALNEQLRESELSLNDIKTIFDRQFLTQLNKIYLCGNYGDAAAAMETLEIVRYFRHANSSLIIGIHSNGGARPPSWWAELATSVTYCRFGIDGLEDTNHLYRRNTSWKKIMANLTAFITAGGNAQWAFIAFDHNRHQINDARDLSRRLGVRRFVVKRTGRFKRTADGNVAPLIVRAKPVASCTKSLLRLMPCSGIQYSTVKRHQWRTRKLCVRLRRT